jgi:virginiamycin A acetyltransferase
MKIITEQNILGIEKDHRWAEQFTILRYKDGAYSSIPKGFFRNWLDQDISGANFGTFYIGRGSGAGVGSIVKYDGNSQSLRMGRYVAGGLRLKFLLGGQHEMGTISTCMWGTFGNGLRNPPHLSMLIPSSKTTSGLEMKPCF